MNVFAALRLSVLGYMIFAGVLGTVGTSAYRLYVGPAEPTIVVSHSGPSLD